MNKILHFWISHYKYYSLLVFCTGLFVITTQSISSLQIYQEQARSANSFVDSIGVAVHLDYTDTAYGKYKSIIKPRLQELGVRHIRDGVSPKDLNTQKKFNDLATLGIKSTLVMDPRKGLSASQAVGIAKSTAASVEAVEGPNEWDVWHKFTYKGKTFPTGVYNFQTDLYAAIKADPATAHLEVLSPSMAHLWNAVKLGSVPCDFGNMHSYAGGGVPTAGLDKWISAAQVICNSKPIVATECGWHNATGDEKASQLGVSERVAGRYVPRLYLEYFNRNIKRAFIYELIDERRRANQENNFGLLRNDGSPKPAFKALKNLISLLKDSRVSFSPQSLKYTLSGNTKNVHHTLLQKSNGKFYLILWLEVPSFNTKKKTDIYVPEQKVTLTINTPIRKTTIYQPINSTTPIEQNASLKQLVLSVPDYPLVLELVPDTPIKQS